MFAYGKHLTIQKIDDLCIRQCKEMESIGDPLQRKELCIRQTERVCVNLERERERERARSCTINIEIHPIVTWLQKSWFKYQLT